jgi:hypothetical protein
MSILAQVHLNKVIMSRKSPSGVGVIDMACQSWKAWVRTRIMAIFDNISKYSSKIGEISGNISIN